MDSTGYVVIISAVFIGLTQLLTLYLSHSREQAKLKRDHEMGLDIRKIELATNSMKDALVAKTDEAAEGRGQIKERARADAALPQPVTIENTQPVAVSIKEKPNV